jgi:hypothetical protein
MTSIPTRDARTSIRRGVLDEIPSSTQKLADEAWIHKPKKQGGNSILQH